MEVKVMKRIIYVLITIVMLVMCLSGCGSNQNDTVESKDTTISSDTENVFLYTTKNKSDYLNYLSNLDTSEYEILGISTSITELYKAQEFYMISINGYYVFTTKDSKTYLDFIDGLDFTQYKILGISTSITELYKAQEFYMITYCEQ